MRFNRAQLQEQVTKAVTKAKRGQRVRVVFSFILGLALGVGVYYTVTQPNAWSFVMSSSYASP